MGYNHYMRRSHAAITLLYPHGTLKLNAVCDTMRNTFLLLMDQHFPLLWVILVIELYRKSHEMEWC